jgi:hypothetical protein
MLDYQGMVCLAASRVWWTAEVENVFEKAEQVNWEFQRLVLYE